MKELIVSTSGDDDLVGWEAMIHPWICPLCGRQNTNNERCWYCGHLRPAALGDMVEETDVADTSEEKLPF